MRKSLFFVACALLGTLAGAMIGTTSVAQAQNTIARTGDPARWYVEDATAQAQMRTLHKEIGAALQEAQKECRQAPAPERNDCLKQARATYQQDMANAQQQRATAHPR